MIPSMSLESTDAEPAGSGQRWRMLDDPLAIRAMAHPLRLNLMSLIGRLGRATTADAARELGISHGLASHHLRQLAKYGFVEQVKGKDHRERPWRMTATSYNWRAATATTEGTGAVDVLEQTMAERALEGFLDWQQRRKHWPQEWRENTGIGNSTVYLTQAELAGLAEAMDDLINHYANERPLDDVASRPAGSVPVNFTLFAVPGSEPPGPAESGG
jgi:predicted ArsR family transcriptional regulator